MTIDQAYIEFIDSPSFATAITYTKLLANLVYTAEDFNALYPLVQDFVEGDYHCRKADEFREKARAYMALANRHDHAAILAWAKANQSR